MSSNQQFEQDDSQNFSDGAVRRFLLGQLKANEQSAFEARLFADSELEQRVRLAEFELSDDYACARLSRGEREMFRERFLLTADRNQKLKVSKALHTHFVISSASPTTEPVGAKIKNLFGFKRLAWRYAFAGLILMVLLATVVLVTRDPQIAVRFIPKRIAPRPAATATPQLANHSTNSPSPTHVEQPLALPLHEPTTISATLAPKIPIESSPVITRRTNELDVVRLQIIVERPQAETYAVDLMTLSGESLFTGDSLKPTEPDKIILDVPARVLTVGDFQVSLTRVNGESKESVAVYYFRVR